jgi:phosphodiester glycosidase/sporulation related protein
VGGRSDEGFCNGQAVAARWVAILAALLCAATAMVGLASAGTGDGRPRPLDLGPSGLPESREVQSIQPGVTLTRITRGAPDPAAVWVVEMNIPGGVSSPDPDAPPRSIQDQSSAETFAARLTDAGFPSEAQRVEQPQTADVPAGVLGYRVRLRATFPTQAAASAEVARLAAAGFSGRAWYSGWDGDSAARGPWTVNVVTVDPRRFRGTLRGTYGPTLEDREKTTELAALERASVALNGGFFVFDPAAGADGDPAGAGVYRGRLQSEPVGDRPVLVLHNRARHSDIVRPSWSGSVRLRAGTGVLDGLNRVPGLIRNCGGTLDDLPTWRPLHDVTCTDDDELVLFTPAFGPTTPAGAGAEAILDRSGRVVAVADSRGTALRAGQRSLQATGDLAPAVAALRPGDRVHARTAVRYGARSLARPGTTVVNGGPLLMKDGVVHITQQRDGMQQVNNPSFDYGWVLQRNPRTFAGTDARGRTLFVTVDGRQLGELGLSIAETAAVARSLGMIEAINLDGGGSTAMVIRGSLISHPSDASGERAVGDAIVIR